jgi:hypothetical protein
MDDVSKVHKRLEQKKEHYTWIDIEQLTKQKIPEIKIKNYENIY